MNEHENIKQLISQKYDGEHISQEEQKLVELHIKECADCRAYIKDCQKLSQTLKVWADEDLSPDLAQKIQKALLLEKVKETKQMNEKPTNFRMAAGVGVLVAICVLAITMQQYSKRTLQARVKDAAVYLQTKTASLKSNSSEPYYLDTDYAEQRDKGLITELPSFVVDDLEQYAKANAPVSNFKSRVSSSLGSGDEVQTEAMNYRILNSQQTFWGGNTVDSSNRPNVQLAQVRQTGRVQKPGRPSGFDKERNVSSLASLKKSKNEGIGGPAQYEPYYLESNYSVENEKQVLASRGLSRSADGLVIVDQIAAHRVGEDSRYRQEIAPGKSFRRYDDIYTEREELDYYGDYDQPQDLAYGNREEYKPIYENAFLAATQNPLSTFSIDVDTASYSNVRRFLNNNQLPPEDAVRIEELVNYFNYDYPKPSFNQPFSVTTKASICPWNRQNYLVQIGLQGKIPPARKLAPSNLVFLIDVSGSMNQPNKLPLLKQGFKMMVDQLRPEDHVAIVTYSGSARVALTSTSGNNKHVLYRAIDNLRAGGGTSGEAGLRLAYKLAHDNFIRKGNNRILLATDGDFNVGVSSDQELVQIIENKRREGVFLSILGFGTGNLKDGKLEQIADKGNGHYSYIDSNDEAHKVLVAELGSTLFTIAKDVKIQVEFNPQQVEGYRLIGYENRALANRDFNNDRIDAGEIGAGHTVTAFYEIVPTYKGQTPHQAGVDELKYQKRNPWSNHEMMTVKLRYKEPNQSNSRLIKKIVKHNDITNRPGHDFQFAASVAEFGLLLKNSAYKAHASYDRILHTAQQTRGKDVNGYRGEFIDLIKKARSLDHRPVRYHPNNQNPEPAYPENNSNSGFHFK